MASWSSFLCCGQVRKKHSKLGLMCFDQNNRFCVLVQPVIQSIYLVIWSGSHFPPSQAQNDCRSSSAYHQPHFQNYAPLLQQHPNLGYLVLLYIGQETLTLFLQKHWVFPRIEFRVKVDLVSLNFVFWPNNVTLRCLRSVHCLLPHLLNNTENEAPPRNMAKKKKNRGK